MKEPIVLSIFFIIYYKIQSKTVLELTPEYGYKTYVPTKLQFTIKFFVTFKGVNTTWGWT